MLISVILYMLGLIIFIIGGLLLLIIGVQFFSIGLVGELIVKLTRNNASSNCEYYNFNE